MRQMQDAIEAVGGAEVLDGRLLTSQTGQGGEHATSGRIVLLNAFVNKIQHGLGRRLVGYLLCDLVASAAAAGHVERVTSVAGPPVARPDDTKELWLRPVGFGGADAHVRIWVF